ncbi:Haloalkane dehalogenase 2 [Defluviimonas aquaemixtae]|uniref:Haloalkane dehalogenase 2 n=1 Tax=Albidovulum aquaemixtae TaxID=1542388 RepID=A0A2R8BL87_9RHOB|nr:alpha/beta hydrolase [Defluviimonas aquaemixtae]SPH24124.1 Haloalkane dehalogenase 2 [Defluviimonas aquaemixtae]
MSARDLIAEWKAQGAPLSVPGANSRIWRVGSGPPVVCLHGVPASGFLYRKVIAALSARGMEGITFDLPGLGFADRPESFDYSWTGLSRWTEEALAAAGIGKFHLVVHDIGGPIGFELATRNPDRILSLTALNTLVDVASFHRPWMMEPFAWPVLGRLWLAPMETPVLWLLMRYSGMLGAPSYSEIMAYGALLKREDGGRAFLKIMRGFERTEAFETRIKKGLKARRYPAQVIWGRSDPALRMNKYAPSVCEALGLEGWHEVAGKHFVQEDSFEEIAERISSIAAQS